MLYDKIRVAITAHAYSTHILGNGLVAGGQVDCKDTTWDTAFVRSTHCTKYDKPPVDAGRSCTVSQHMQLNGTGLVAMQTMCMSGV
jgi:hypothetical protein